MRSRAPRGLTTGGHPPLVPIAWGEVQWNSLDQAVWLGAGGEFGSGPTTVSPTETTLRLSRGHDPARLLVQVTPHTPAAGSIYEEAIGVAEVRESRTGQSISLRSPLDVVGYGVIVYEEQ